MMLFQLRGTCRDRLLRGWVLHFILTPRRPAPALRNGDVGHPVWWSARTAAAAARQAFEAENRLFDLFPLRLQFSEDFTDIHHTSPPSRPWPASSQNRNYPRNLAYDSGYTLRFSP